MGLQLSKDGRYLESLKNGRIFIWTARLAMRNDMVEFFPEFNDGGELVRKKASADKITELEDENARLRALISNSVNLKPIEKVDPTIPEKPDELDKVLDEDDDEDSKDEEIVLGPLEEPLTPGKVKPITREFLLTKDRDQLRDFALKVYGEKLNPLKKQETLVENILELQKKTEL